MIQIAPSILSADFARLEQEILKVETAGADLLHIDVMDGHFVPNLTFGPPVVKAIRKVTQLPFDVHLMVDKPEEYVRPFAEAGANIITIHAEATPHLHRVVQSIKEHRIQAGVALNPATPLCVIEEILHDLDLILIMSVNPGFGGQKFIPSALKKIRRLKTMLMQINSPALIEVDGGVTSENAAQLKDAGADILVAGSAIYGVVDCQAAIASLKKV
ncbi:ribulose phosphate epimerase [Anaerosporomusa subterranea]|uniref:Ribulose-phosphate 3-epimerase n=1 Tax=Anaerosporomusa subterranea TaxID=1794912 RepID=A0A154BUL5_ANASB|nr:ribulose-phosphate 3-epimerase [Anaerosporomusa subterranea]KYZ77198.1 ribulose phosphate epimerase [Anaerosporomusa subterranea]